MSGSARPRTEAGRETDKVGEGVDVADRALDIQGRVAAVRRIAVFHGCADNHVIVEGVERRPGSKSVDFSEQNRPAAARRSRKRRLSCRRHWHASPPGLQSKSSDKRQGTTHFWRIPSPLPGNANDLSKCIKQQGHHF